MAVPMFNYGAGSGSDLMRAPQTDGSNQYGSYPMFNFTTPGNASQTVSTGAGSGQPAPADNPYQVPPASSGPLPPPAHVNDLDNPGHVGNFPVGSALGIGGGNRTIPTFDPNMTAQFYSFLQQQIGGAATPFNLGTPLPTGGSTQAGQISAGLNPIDQSLMDFYSSGGTQGGTPGMQTLAGFANGINTLPEFQAMIAAQNGPLGPIAQQEAQMRGQFAKSGALAGSEYGNAEAGFRSQTAADQNALMAQLMMQGLGIQEGAATTLGQAGTAFGQSMQGLNQDAINRQMAEFIRTRPEYSPYLNMLFGGATSSPGAMNSKVGVGAAGAAIGSAGSALQGIADLWGQLKNSGAQTASAVPPDFSGGE